MSKKALLIILDGYGIGDHKKDDVIFNTPTPYIDSLVAEYPHSQLQASGENVGLPDGQMGNSEVGHLNIGAGRVVYQDLVKINRAIADGSFAENQEIKNAFTYAQKNGVPIHFMGLASAGGVHSSLGHLYALCDTAKAYGLDKVFIHAFMDGRDTDPKSGAGFLQEIQDHCKQSTGTIASVVGRYYAMDRDHRWERIKDAYNLLVYGEGKHADNMVKAVEESYTEGVTDEFIKPIVNDRVDGRIGAGHVVIFFNYRNDRAKELTTVLTQHSEDGMNPIPDLQYYCMTPYDDSFKGVHILFPKEVRSRYILLQRRQGGTIPRRRPHSCALTEGRHLRPAAGNERAGSDRQTRRADRQREIRLYRRELRQRRYGGTHRCVFSYRESDRHSRQMR